MIVGMNNYRFSERLEHFILWNGDVVFSVSYEVNLNGSFNVVVPGLTEQFESVCSVECTPYIRLSLEPSSS